MEEFQFLPNEFEKHIGTSPHNRYEYFNVHVVLSLFESSSNEFYLATLFLHIWAKQLCEISNKCRRCIQILINHVNTMQYETIHIINKCEDTCCFCSPFCIYLLCATFDSRKPPCVFSNGKTLLYLMNDSEIWVELR